MQSAAKHFARFVAIALITYYEQDASLRSA
jgi:CO dehydrogenase/acetyl-CoA synthase epsilon subunit